MDGEAGWWTTSGNIGLPPLARVMGVGRQQQQNREVYKIKKALNIFTRESRRSKEKFEIKMAEKIKHDLKSFFSYPRSKSRTKYSVAPLRDRNGDFTTDSFY